MTCPVASGWKNRQVVLGTAIHGFGAAKLSIRLHPE